MRLVIYHGTTWQRENARRFVRWYTNTFMPGNVVAGLHLQVNLPAKDVPDLNGDYGICLYDLERSSIGLERCKVIVRSPKNISHYKFLSRLAHECVHVKQYTTHELKDVAHGNIFKKVRYEDGSMIDEQWSAPWEVEAFGSETYLTSEYARAFDMESDIFKPYVSRVLF